MAGKRRLWPKLLLIAALLVTVPIMALATTVAVTGVVTVRVEEAGGTDLYIPVPALLVDLGAYAVPKLIPQHELRQAREELDPYLPALAEVADQLRSCPDGTVLLEVDGRDERVRVAKQGRSFLVEVVGEDGRVRVALPARLLSKAVHILG